MRPIKVYVDVNATFNKEGQMIPRFLVWEDGRTYPIERVRAIRPAHAERAGGQGDRYTIFIDGKETYLFFEHNAESEDPKIGRWFVERRSCAEC